MNDDHPIQNSPQAGSTAKSTQAHASTITTAQLDLLVDGELSPSAYAELLNQLESEPDSWRRCALAFLERQAWERGLTNWSTEKPLGSKVSAAAASYLTALERPSTSVDQHTAGSPNTTQSPTPSHDTSSSKSPLQQSHAATGTLSYRRWSGLAIAAITGYLLGNLPSLLDLGTPVAPKSGFELVQETGAPDKRYVPQISPSTPQQNGVPLVQTPSTVTASSPWTFVVQEGRIKPSGGWEIPVYDWENQDARQQLQQAARLPRAWENELRRTGLTVRRRRQLAPVPLENGRTGVVPWEEVEILPATNTVMP